MCPRRRRNGSLNDSSSCIGSKTEKYFSSCVTQKSKMVKRLILYYQYAKALILNVNLKCTKHRYLLFVFT